MTSQFNPYEIQGMIRRYRAKSVGQKMTLMVIGEYMGLHDKEWSCWPGIATIASEGQQNTSTVRRHLAELEEQGVIERRTRGREGGGRDFTLIVLVVESLLDQSAPKARIDSPTKARPGADQSALSEGAKRALDGFAPLIGTTKEQLGTSPPADADEAPSNDLPVDPIKNHAHRLAVLAMEQPVKPVLRSNGNPFCAVQSIFERSLRAGRSVQELERAVTAGIDVWTDAGVQTSVARTRPGNGYNGRAAGEAAVLENVRRRRQA